MWQPIETAPRDGTKIIACAGSEITIVYWHPYKNLFSDGYWLLAVPGDWCEDAEWRPEYWMPLPNPPKEEQE